MPPSRSGLTRIEIDIEICTELGPVALCCGPGVRLEAVDVCACMLLSAHAPAAAVHSPMFSCATAQAVDAEFADEVALSLAY